VIFEVVSLGIVHELAVLSSPLRIAQVPLVPVHISNRQEYRVPHHVQIVSVNSTKHLGYTLTYFQMLVLDVLASVRQF